MIGLLELIAAGVIAVVLLMVGWTILRRDEPRKRTPSPNHEARQVSDAATVLMRIHQAKTPDERGRLTWWTVPLMDDGFSVAVKCVNNHIMFPDSLPRINGTFPEPPKCHVCDWTTPLILDGWHEVNARICQHPRWDSTSDGMCPDPTLMVGSCVHHLRCTKCPVVVEEPCACSTPEVAIQ